MRFPVVSVYCAAAVTTGRAWERLPKNRPPPPGELVSRSSPRSTRRALGVRELSAAGPRVFSVATQCVASGARATYLARPLAFTCCWDVHSRGARFGACVCTSVGVHPAAPSIGPTDRCTLSCLGAGSDGGSTGRRRRRNHVARARWFADCFGC